MAQFEKVFKHVEGYEYVITKCVNGDVIIRLVKKEEGKDEYFTKITEQDRKNVKNWLDETKGKTNKEEDFLDWVKHAIHEVDYDYWIATLEPSVEDGKIYYAKNENVGVGFSFNQWKQMARSYAPERGSRLASIDELFIWYALRIVNNFWTLADVANNFPRIGDEYYTRKWYHFFNRTGKNEIGGYCDGQGNTYKIVTIENGDNSNISIDVFPFSVALYSLDPNYVRYGGTGVLVLTK